MQAEKENNLFVSAELVGFVVLKIDFQRVNYSVFSGVLHYDNKKIPEVRFFKNQAESMEQLSFCRDF